MARPINPQAARRESEGGPVEILGSAGRWVPVEYFSGESARRIRQAWPNGFPDGVFECEVGKDPMPSPRPESEGEGESQGQGEGESQGEGEGQGESESEGESEGEGEGQGEGEAQGEGESQPATLEDIIRRIAREEASELDDSVVSSFVDLIDARLKDYEPKGGGGGEWRPITVEVTVRRPDGEEYKSGGLFHQEFPTLLHLIGTGQHVYMPGPPGSGKSHAAKQAADAIGWRYAELSMSPDMPESRMWGGRTPEGFIETPLLDGLRYAMANPDSGFVFLLDEMDAGRAGLIVSMNTAAANCRVTAPNGDVLEWGDNVVFIGAANTFGTGPTAEFAGRNKLDPATLDRFATLPWDTDEGMERAVIGSFLPDGRGEEWGDAWRILRANIKEYGIKHFVTMRGARNGARLIASGLSMSKAMDLVAGNKLPADQWAKVNPLR